MTEGHEEFGERRKLKSGITYFIKGDVVSYKECSKCRKMKSASDFNRQATSKIGLNPSCKQCQAEYRKGWAERNPDYDRKYDAEHKAERAAKNKRFREKNPEYSKKWYLANKEKVDEYQRGWRQENRGYYNKYKQEYRKRNKESEVARQERRRARERQLPHDMTPDQYKEILRHFNYSCALTGRKENLHADHVIPLSTGEGGTVVGNIIPLNESINASKGDRNIFEWYAAHGMRLGISHHMFSRLIKYLAGVNDLSEQEYKSYVYRCHSTGDEEDSDEKSIS